MLIRHSSQRLMTGLKMGRTMFLTPAIQASQPNNPQRNLTSAAKSKAKSSKNPENLPHFPVPPLDESLQKYLNSVKPLLSAEEFSRTECVVGEFGAPNGEGTKLHDLLRKRADTHENWLSDWWLKFAYLGFRSPVVINSNPGLFYNVNEFKSESEWLGYAARSIWATMRFKVQIDTKQIPTDMMGKARLDMEQYGMIFGTCRVPAEEFDNIQYNPESKYVIVVYKNGFYQVPVYNPKTNCVLDESNLLSLLQQCVADSCGANPPIGALTALHRDKLAVAYKALVRDCNNAKVIQIIQRGLFVVCLDQPVAIDTQDILKTHNTGSHQLIHGGGSVQNAANRWYDKTLQLVVNRNGLAGLNYEHSPGEGQPIAVLSDAIMTYTKQTAKEPVLPAKNPVAQMQRLEISVDDELQRHLDEAMAHTDELSNSLDMHVVDYLCYGKSFIKQQKMSPDSYLQMAMQYAFYKKHGVPGAHYESGQQRMFIHGRTETIRSCSNESVAFAQAMCSPEVSDADKVRALLAAVDGHKRYALEAMTGKGVDRLLLGLKLIAREKQMEVPAFYADAGFVKSTHFRLSTSQVASAHRAFMCYGPSVEDGYGICYNPRDKDMLFAVSAFSGCAATSAKEMGCALSDALNDMFELLVRAGEKPKSKM